MEDTSRRRFVVVAGSTLTLGLAGCAGGGETTTTGGTGTTETTTGGGTTETTTTMNETTTSGTTSGEMASLRVAHLSPDAPAVDVLVDGETALSDVQYETISDYLSVPTGDHDVTVQTSSDGTVVFDDTLTLDASKYTAAAIGEVSGTNKQFQVSVFEDGPGMIETGSAKVRLVHTSPDAPAVDVAVKGSQDNPLFTDVAFGEASDYVSVPKGDYTLEVRPSGSQGSGDPVITVDVSLAGSSAQTAFAVGYVSPSDAPANAPLNVLLADDVVPQG